MITKLFFRTSVISVILVQISWAKSLPEKPLAATPPLESKDLCLLQTKYDKMENSEKDSLLSPSYQLLQFTLKSFKDLSLTYARKAKTISEQLLKNSQILASHSKKVLEFKQNLMQFEEKYSLCDGIDDLFELVNLYSNTTSFYFKLGQNSLGDDDDDDDVKLIRSLLKKYGSEELDKESLKLFDIFVDNFEDKFSSLKTNISKEESNISKKMLQWFAHFNALTNYDDKIAAFENFFILFEEDDD